ncbi:hypothetical protein [Kitasatospora sp. NPDC051164]|uniref:hypothetical protein n=1 Tax=Kitasatospora sp. NPDC051164 TaxID=3364055 RepID=UPI0037B72649
MVTRPDPARDVPTLEQIGILADTAGRRTLTPAEAYRLRTGLNALGNALKAASVGRLDQQAAARQRAEIDRLRALTADYEQVIESQRAELLKTRATLAGTGAALRRADGRARQAEANLQAALDQTAA